MKKFIIYLILPFFFFGCVSKIKEFKKPNVVQSTEVLSFDQVDLDESGEISEKEFKNARTKSSVNYWDPLLGFSSVIATVAILLTLSNFIQSRKKRENV
jgi:hypothetical protein